MEKFEIGSLVEGRYEVKEKVGSGGMASVYLAYDVLTNTHVAIKVIEKSVLTNPVVIERFQIETESIAELIDSKYVVKLHDVIQKNTDFLLILEYVEGGDFKKYLAMFSPLTLTEIKYFFGDLTKALEKVHEKKIIHRDIKPENVLLTLDKQVKLTDFGISLMQGYDKEKTKSIGTPKYIAPEVLLQKEATACTDIYSLGIMMYEAAVGTVPFKSTDRKKISAEHLYQKPFPPREINPSIPQGLENLILKMIEKDPELRYQSMKEVRMDLMKINEIIVKPYLYKGKYRDTSKEGSRKIRTADDLNSRRKGVINVKTITTFLIFGLILLMIFVGLLLWMI